MSELEHTILRAFEAANRGKLLPAGVEISLRFRTSGHADVSVNRAKKAIISHEYAKTDPERPWIVQITRTGEMIRFTSIEAVMLGSWWIEICLIASEPLPPVVHYEPGRKIKQMELFK